MRLITYFLLSFSCLLAQNLSSQKAFQSIQLEALSEADSLLVDDYSIKFEYLTTIGCVQIDEEVLFKYASAGDFKSSIITTLKEDSFRVTNFEFTDVENYRWSAMSLDKKTTLDLKRSSIGITGILNILENNAKYIISPLMDNLCLVSLQEDTQSPTCNFNPANCVLFGADCGEDPFVDSPCNESCPSHIDILFLLTPEALAYYGSEEIAIANMDLMIMDLERVWRNSNIVNTVSYQWKEHDFDVSFDIPCAEVACELSSNDEEAHFLRNLYNADLVTLITGPQTWNSLACVSNYGPDESNAYLLQPAHNALDNFSFVHEIGHLFGLEHNWFAQRKNCCGHGNTFFIDGVHRSTVMANSLAGDIPHYSDPGINYLGVPTGSVSSFNGRKINAAGWVRGKSCEIGDFRNSTTARASISATLTNCDYQFDLNYDLSENILSSYTLNWYLTEDGQLDLSNLENETLAGSGSSVITSHSVAWNPCENYFIHLVVASNESLITSHSLMFRGGGCTQNVWCGGGTEDKSLSTPSTWVYDNTNAFYLGSTRHYYLRDTTIGGLHFLKYGRQVVRHLLGRDTLMAQYSPYYIAEREGYTLASFYGETPDTLYNFNAIPGSSWELTYGGRSDRLNDVVITVVDTFTNTKNGQQLQGQILEFDHNQAAQGPYTDTVYSGIGSLHVYINPFDFFEHGPDSRQGNALRCFNNADLGSLSFNSEQLWGYEVDCTMSPTSAFTPTHVTSPRLIVSPNPFKNDISIVNNSPKSISAQLFTLLGHSIKTIKLQPGRNVVPLSQFPAGLYFLVSPDTPVVRVIKH